MANPVLESTKFLTQDTEYVDIDQERLKEVVKEFSKWEFKLPIWDEPVFLHPKYKRVGDIIDQWYNEREAGKLMNFEILGNSINFCYKDPWTKEQYGATYLGKEYKGSFAMWGSLKSAVEEGRFDMNGLSFKDITVEGMEAVFGKGMPLMEERAAVFREIGTVLERKYDGTFANLVKESGHRLFNDGKGLVELLASDFSTFDDSYVVGGKKAVFNKRAQLAGAVLHAASGGDNTSPFYFSDSDKLTVFADYILPRNLRDLGILRYKNGLGERVDREEIVFEGSREELEIRAATVHAADMILVRLNNLLGAKRKPRVNATHLDYVLWMTSKVERLIPHLSPHHLTPTIRY